MRVEDMKEKMRVRIIGPRGVIPWNFEGRMDKFRGMVVTVKEVNKDRDGKIFFKAYETGSWIFDPEDCDPEEVIDINFDELKELVFG